MKLPTKYCLLFIFVFCNSFAKNEAKLAQHFQAKSSLKGNKEEKGEHQTELPGIVSVTIDAPGYGVEGEQKWIRWVDENHRSIKDTELADQAARRKRFIDDQAALLNVRNFEGSIYYQGMGELPAAINEQARLEGSQPPPELVAQMMDAEERRKQFEKEQDDLEAKEDDCACCTNSMKFRENGSASSIAAEADCDCCPEDDPITDSSSSTNNNGNQSDFKDFTEISSNLSSAFLEPVQDQL